MHILVAEDDPSTLRIICRVLEQLGHRTTQTNDGEKAWIAFNTEKPDVIISDWQMPNCNGIELCRRVRENGGPYTHFIMLTSHSAHQQRVDGMLAGADDYLRKPLDKDLSKVLGLRLIAAERLTRLHATMWQQQQELERLNVQLYRDGRRCPLTAIANRLQLDEDLAKLHATTHRHGNSFCLAILDIDFFKPYNDTCGHVAGDEVLRKVAAALQDAARMSDRVYRYGGEEFVAVFVYGDIQGAIVAAERMRQAVETLAIPHPGRPEGTVITLSGGVMSYSGTPALTIAEIVEQADKALYQAKHEGKNKIIAG